MAEISQRPGALNIIYTQGDDLPIQINLGFNYTGHQITAQVDEINFEDPIPILISMQDPIAGDLKLTFPRATFAILPTSTRTWSMIVKYPDQTIRKFLAGTFQIVTR